MKKNENKYNDIIIEHSNYYRRITENANKTNSIEEFKKVADNLLLVINRNWTDQNPE